MRHRQDGITLIGFIFVLIIAGFFALMALKLVPAYIEYFGVVKAMNQLAEEPGAANMSLTQVRGNLDFKASFQYVDGDTLSNGKAVQLDRQKGKTNLVVDYNKTIPFVYNISFLLHFNKTVSLTGNVG